MNQLRDSWNAFSSDIAVRYLKTYGYPSLTSKALLLDVLRHYTVGDKPHILDLGCGNAQMGEYFRDQGFACNYTGVDFSDVLLDAGRRALPTASFIKDDISVLSEVHGNYNVALYSHVVELLTAPEDALAAAARLATMIVIRFFEPPEFETDSVELCWMDVGQPAQVPYLRRKMSHDYYRLLLARLRCKQVDIYRDVSKDQIHVLKF